MATGIHRETAKILQFPAGGRSGFNNADKRSAVEFSTVKFTPVVDYGSWYHDEAIREEDQGCNKPNA